MLDYKIDKRYEWKFYQYFVFERKAIHTSNDVEKLAFLSKN
jgi:hypothetical protein